MLSNLLKWFHLANFGIEHQSVAFFFLKMTGQLTFSQDGGPQSQCGEHSTKKDFQGNLQSFLWVWRQRWRHSLVLKIPSVFRFTWGVPGELVKTPIFFVGWLILWTDPITTPIIFCWATDPIDLSYHTYNFCWMTDPIDWSHCTNNFCRMTDPVDSFYYTNSFLLGDWSYSLILLHQWFYVRWLIALTDLITLTYPIAWILLSDPIAPIVFCWMTDPINWSYCTNSFLPGEWSYWLIILRL